MHQHLGVSTAGRPSAPVSGSAVTCSSPRSTMQRHWSTAHGARWLIPVSSRHSSKNEGPPGASGCVGARPRPRAPRSPGGSRPGALTPRSCSRMRRRGGHVTSSTSPQASRSPREPPFAAATRVHPGAPRCPGPSRHTEWASRRPPPERAQRRARSRRGRALAHKHHRGVLLGGLGTSTPCALAPGTACLCGA